MRYDVFYTIVLSVLLLGPKPCPGASNQPTASAPGQIAIRLVAGGWGDAPLENIERVLRSAAAQLLPYFAGRTFRPIVVEHTTGDPIVLYKKGADGETRIRLSATATYWAQYTYQFAHEFCHVLCRYDKIRSDRNANQWFEEALCETASIFVIQRMAVAWQTAPPYSNWKSFSPALARYADNLIRKESRQLPADTSLAQWYRQQEADLRKHGTQRELNGVVANRLLVLFNAQPEHWAAVEFLNEGPSDAAQSFEDYLRNWHHHAPEKHKQFIRQVAALFAVEW